MAITFRAPTTTVVLRLTYAVVTALVLACSSRASRSGDAATAPTPAAQAGPGALARFASEQLLVLPLQDVATADPLGWRATMGTELQFIVRFDSLLEAELTERRLAAKWAFATTLQRAARRNPTYLADPYSVRAMPSVMAQMRKPDETLAEPFASQLRAFAGVSAARYALVPLDVRFDSSGQGGRAVARLAMIDARVAKVTWYGEVPGDVSSAYTPTILPELIQRVADLVIPR